MTLKWVFFDIGNVLLNDDAIMATVFRHIWESVCEKGYDITFEQLLRQREEMSARGTKLRIHHEVALQYLSMDEWKRTRRRYLDETLPKLGKICQPMPGMKTVIRHLKSKVNLGIIANQPDDVIPVLEEHGFWEPFSVKGISEVVGLSKPDPDFFKWALGTAGCHAKEAVLVGDTIKYDIRPAHRLGLKTIWFDVDISRKRYKPKNRFEKLYIESLCRMQKAKREKVKKEVRPDAIVHNGKQLLEVLKNWINSK